MRAAALLLLLGLGACGTRFVDLSLPDGAPAANANGGSPGMPDADPALRCESVKRSDGTECKICYAPDGTIVNGACLPVPGMIPSTAIDPATAICKALPMPDGSRCLACTSGPNEYTACLKCEAPTKTAPAGDTCRACVWSDQAVRCLQCFDYKGLPTHDDCDTFRKEKFTPVVPPPSN
jgi:hypothetical protein